MKKIIDKFIKIVDWGSEFLGKIAGLLIFLLVLLLTFEVTMRNVFNSPTLWSYDVSWMVGGLGCILAAAMCLKNKRHIRVDLLYQFFPPRFKAIWNIIFSLILFFPMMIFGLYRVYMATGKSISLQEEMQTGVYAFPIYPLKIGMTIALTMLLLQGLVELLQNIRFLRQKEVK